MSLRTALAEAWTAPSDRWQPCRVQQAAAVLAKRFSIGPGKAPAPFILEEVFCRVREVWNRERSLDGVARRDRRWLPHLLFYPVTAPDHQWLAVDEAFVRTFLEHVHGEGRALATTASELLRHYPTQLPSFALLLDRFGRALEKDTSLWTEVWRARHGAHRLFAPDGPKRIATALMDAEEPVSDILAAAGLTDDLVNGAFARETQTTLLTRVHETLEGRPGPHALDRPLAFLLKDERTLRFEDQAWAFGDALLRPHITRDPLANTKARIEALVLTHLRDPRLWPQKWHKVHPDAKALFLRWLVGATLEDFFRLIEKNAWMQHWQYRRAFWTAYLNKGYIHDAWVVLGERARQLARSAFNNEHLAYGKLTGGDKDHSVLLLRIDNVIIAEWSHNGKCRAWLSGNSAAPAMHRVSYTRGELTNEPSHQKSHQGSENYNWQQDLASWIARETGARVNQTDYIVRRAR